jgi:hypothetical protein
MTCFWNGLISRLTIEEINKTLKCNLYDKPDPKLLVTLLKHNAIHTTNVECVESDNTTVTLSKKALDENLEWILSYDTNKIYDGHDCSTSDPFLLLVSQLFTVDIYHTYNSKYFIKYLNKNNICGKILSISSDRGHLW